MGTLSDRDTILEVYPSSLPHMSCTGQAPILQLGITFPILWTECFEGQNLRRIVCIGRRKHVADIA